VLWTKDPRNLLVNEQLNQFIQKYPTIIQLTITGLGGTWWEPGVPDARVVVSSVAELSKVIPAAAIRWRFDPIIPEEESVTLKRFLKVKSLLNEAGFIPDEITTSFMDFYPKVALRLKFLGYHVPELSLERKKALLESMFDEGKSPFRMYGEPDFLSLPFVKRAQCVDGVLFDKIYGSTVGCLGKDWGQRHECGCVASTDIGDYEMTCLHNCRYCYARGDLDEELPG